MRQSSTAGFVARITGVALLTGLLALSANAKAADASPECKALASRVAHAAGVNVDKQSEQNAAFVFKTAHGADIRVRCASESQRSAVVEVNSSAELPPRPFYDMLAKVGASVSGRSAKDVRKRVHRCHRVAKRTPNGLANRALHGVGIECHRSEAGSTFRLKGPFLRQQPASSS